MRSLHFSYPLNAFRLLPIMKTACPIRGVLVQDEKEREEKERDVVKKQLLPSMNSPPPHSLAEHATYVKEESVSV